MESFKTAFRLIVMLAAIGMGYKAWQHFGPPAGQLKELAVRGLDAARSALESPRGNENTTTALTADPRPMAPPLAAPVPTAVPDVVGPVIQAQAIVPTNDFRAPSSITPPALAPAPTPLAEPVPAVAEANPQVLPAATTAEDPLKPLYERLEQLGAHQPQLKPWGSGGQLYRFSCQASLGELKNFNRHFDAIAAEPHAAVEAVIAKVEAWRNSQNATAQLGTPLR